MAHGAKSYTLTAGSTSLSDIMSALIAHFSANPGYWDLMDSTAGESLLAVQSSNPDHVISIRRNGTAGWACQHDADGSGATAGSSSNSPGGMSSIASPEIDHNLSSHSEVFFVTEYPDALTIAFQNDIKTTFQSILHAGNCYVPLRPGWAALGLTGDMILLGNPEKNDSALNWIGDHSPSGQSKGLVRAGNGSTKWFAAGTDASTSGGCANTESGTLPGDSLNPPYFIYAGSISGNTSYPSSIGLAKYLSHLSKHLTGNFTTIPNRSVLVGAVDGWLGFDDNSTTTDELIAWERSHTLS